MAQRPALEGHSGCSLTFVQSPNGHRCVRKTSRDAPYNSRLREQASRLALLRSTFADLTWVNVPQVLKYGTGVDGLDFYDLPYVHAHSSLSFLQTASAGDIHLFCSRLVELVHKGTSKATVEQRKVSAEVFLEKLDSIAEAIHGLPYFNRANLEIDRIRSVIHDVTLPFSEACHGDLTLDNVLVDSNGITLLDPMSGYVNSDAMDLVKLRQDTSIKWTVHRAKVSGTRLLDEARLYCILDYIDDALVDAFAGERWFPDASGFIQGINLLRILPYTTSEGTALFICDALSSLDYT